MTPRLRPQQVRAVEWLRSHDRGMMAGQMRTGKTAVVLSALEARHLPALVVSTRAISQRVWVEEGAVWRPDLDVRAAVGERAARAGVLRGGAQVVSLSVASLDGHERAGDLARFRTLVVDESTLVKGVSSSRSRAARRLSRRVGVCWCLTGTPVPGSSVDLWAQWMVIDGGARLGRSVTAFRDRWQSPGRVLPSGAVVGRVDLEGSLEAVARLVADGTHVMLASEAGRGVPSRVVVEPVRAVMGEVWSGHYRRLEREGVLELGEGDVVPSGRAEVVMRLRQVLTGEVPADGGGVLVADDAGLCAGVGAVLESRLVSPVLVAYSYVSERDRARAMLEAAGLVCAEVRERGAVDAWLSGGLDVLLLHPASAGHGLTLHAGGCEMVWLSPPWSLEHWEQACARLTVWSDDVRRPPRVSRVRVVVPVLHGGRETVAGEVLRRLGARGDAQRGALVHHLR